MAAWSKVWVCGRLFAWIAGSNPAGGRRSLYLVSIVRCQVEVSVSVCSLVQRSPTECGVSECDHARPWSTRGCRAIQEYQLMASHKTVRKIGLTYRKWGGIYDMNQTCCCQFLIGKVKAIPLQAWRGPEGSRRFRLTDFMTIGKWRWWGCQPHAPAAWTKCRLLYIISWGILKYYNSRINH